MFFNANISSIKPFEDLGWRKTVGSDDWFFYSSASSATFLQMNCESGSGSVRIKSISLRLNGQLVGKIFDDTDGHEKLNLLDTKGLGTTVADEFRRALKPLQ